MNTPTDYPSGLSTRAQNVLRVYNIETPEQLASALQTKECNKWRNCGAATVREFRAYLGLAAPVRTSEIAIALKAELEGINNRMAELGMRRNRIREQLVEMTIVEPLYPSGA